ncbi:SurA N-terminal domain-containing protein [Saccharopolyspora sp. K220]|uniref:SurA N-terminal domain-containing protein n=1 Tax=Saccharopolyspora soli TaxID=2926618 RepID=UPI001F597785|nr:SurA N-terminal domain-containing protein [Saccharopolyspora soli]MCI2420690.1 SurA N-terminal domain-containing protein [Saccharopolyspora soli]
MPRHGRLLASIAAAGLLLAGCGSGPSQVGAAAIVGDTRIPVTEVQSWFTEVLAKEPDLKPQLQQQGQLDELGRQLASQLVRQELVEQAARDERLAVGDQQVNDLINQLGGPQAATAGKIYTPRNVREMARTQLLATELGRKYFDGLAVSFDYTQATTRREAEEKAHRMAQGPAAAAALVEADSRSGVPAATGQQLRAADSPQLAAATPLFGAQPGTVLAFESEPNSGQWLVVLIKERRADAPAAAPGAGSADDQTLQGVGMQLLGITADRVGVRLSPRYGVWDPVGLSAAPNEGETTGFRLTSAPDRS